MFASLQDRRGNTGDPEQEGGPAEGERGSSEKAGAECCLEKRETRGEQVIWPCRSFDPCAVNMLSTWFKCKTVVFLPNRKKSLEGIKRKCAEAEEDSEVEDPGMQEHQASAVESDEEVEYYRQAVGEEPDEGEYKLVCFIPLPPGSCFEMYLLTKTFFVFICADMFPSAKKRHGSEKTHRPAKKRKMSPGQPPRRDRDAKSPRRNSPGGHHRDKAGKDWKKSRDGEKPFGRKMKPGGKAFGAKKAGDRERKFGGKKFDGNKTFGGKQNKDKSFKSRGQKGKPGFKSKGAGAKQGFKQRKGKG